MEDPKKALLLYGGRTSQTVKDVLSDFGKLKGVRIGALGVMCLRHRVRTNCRCCRK